MRNPTVSALLWVLVAALGVFETAAAETALEARLRNRLEAGLTSDSLEVMHERVQARETLRRAYPARAYQPYWVDEQGLTEHGQAFAAWLARVPARQGLRSEHYHLMVIDELETVDRLAVVVDLELALSDAFLMIGSHFLAGRLNPESLDSEWVANRRHRDLVPVLEHSATSESAGAVLEELLPSDPSYHVLVQRLAELRELRDTGGWPSIEPGPTLREGDAGPRVAALVDHLRASGDFAGVNQAHFTPDLTLAVQGFQARHGLTADGLVGAATQSVLNVPVQARIDQLIANLERWRWLPESLGDYYIIVNIAGFELDVVRNGESVLDMRVVVGRPYRRTPVFSELISYLVLNPYWEVPTRIAVEDKLPLIKSNPNYLAEQNISLLQGWGEAERRLDPTSIDWSGVTRQNFSYRLRQEPGPYNALGRVKFMFPNKFSVYLHDTPARELFSRDARAFSSGCIRLENPLALAELLLAGQENWSRSAIDSAVRSGREQTVRLTTKVPVHLLYWTAWVDPGNGVLQYREDIYARDAPVLRELREDPPG